MKGTKYVRIRLDFIVHLDREVDSIPLSSAMLGDIMDDAADSAVRKLGGKGLEARTPASVGPDALDQRIATAAEKAREGVVALGYTDGHMRCDLYTPRRKKSAA